MQLLYKSLAGILLLALATACAPDDPAHARFDDEHSADAGPAATGAGLSHEQVAAATSALVAQADSIERKLRGVPGISRKERSGLLRDVNAVQTAKARQVGIPHGASLEPLVKSGRLVKLADTSQYWIVRDLTHSVPYVTPAAKALLIEIGRRFQAELDSLGVPKYRLDITSVLRTPANQSALRKRNANAARDLSAHEFGTTVDIAYRRYAPPAQDSVAGVPFIGELRVWGDSLMVETARRRSAELQAILGRILNDLRSEGHVLVRMERRQTVYHITVTRASPRKGA